MRKDLLGLHPGEPTKRCVVHRNPNDPGGRIYSHRMGTGSQHAAHYRIFLLVYLESFDNVREAIAREKQLKKWRRRWKIDLIESLNPNWDDLYPHI